MNPFESVQTNKPKQNQFDLSHTKLLTCSMGTLIPNLVQEVIPSDTFTVNTELLCRFAPLVAPIYAQLDITQHYFFVPNRLIWTEWEDFITGGENGQDLPSFPRIQMDSNSIAATRESSLADYLGVPQLPAHNTQNEISKLPFRAYQLIYNEFYRDQNMTPELPISLSSGSTGGTTESFLFELRRRAWSKDYFTSALPTTQRGSEIDLPIGSLSVEYLPQTIVGGSGGSGGGTDGLQHNNGLLETDGGLSANIQNIDEAQSTLEAVTINELRRAVRLQEWLELNMRVGGRYREQIFGHFGIKTSDSRLDVPEFLGGGRTPVMISDLKGQTQTDTLPIGEQYGNAIAIGEQSGFKAWFEEHGFIIGILNIQPKYAEYMQGLARHWKKFDKFDYYFPTFAHLGEQPVYNHELYWQVLEPDNEGVFGYQQRYADYKYCQTENNIHGEFRSSLKHYHLAREFGQLPLLNDQFTECTPDENRIFAVEYEDAQRCWVNLYHKISATRPIPYFSIPEL